MKRCLMSVGPRQSIGCIMPSGSPRSRIPRRKKSENSLTAPGRVNDEMLKLHNRLYNDLRVQYGILDKHLSQPGQKWVGLKDRPTIADLAIYPFADDPTMARMGIDKHDFPSLKKWSDDLARVPGVAKAYAELDSRKTITIGP